MFGRTARKPREADIPEGRRSNVVSIADEIRTNLGRMKQEEQERVLSLERQVANASRIEMELRRKIRELESELVISKIREKQSENLSQSNPVNNDPEKYFETLGLHPNAFNGLGDKQIEHLLGKHFRIYSASGHTDVGGNEEKMKSLTEAYHFLMNPKNRAVYGKG